MANETYRILDGDLIVVKNNNKNRAWTDALNKYSTIPQKMLTLEKWSDKTRKYEYAGQLEVGKK